MRPLRPTRLDVLLLLSVGCLIPSEPPDPALAGGWSCAGQRSDCRASAIPFFPSGALPSPVVALGLSLMAGRPVVDDRPNQRAFNPVTTFFGGSPRGPAHTMASTREYQARVVFVRAAAGELMASPSRAPPF